MKKLLLRLLGLLVCLLAVACSDDDENETKQDTSYIIGDSMLISQRRYTDIIYDNDKKMAMDIYLPSKISIKHNGLLVYLHGGAWISGDKSGDSAYCKMFSDKGYITLCPNYSLYNFLPDVNSNVMLNDIANAIQKMKDMSDANGWNINEMAIAGESAGGHLALYFAYSGHKVAYPIRFASVAVAPIDFHMDNWNFATATYDSTYAILMTNALAGKSYTNDNFFTDEAEQSIRSISPLYLANENSVPTILAYGANDSIQNPANGELMANRLEELGVKYDLIIFPNSGHKLNHDKDKLNEYIEKIYEYIDLYFSK